MYNACLIYLSFITWPFSKLLQSADHKIQGLAFTKITSTNSCRQRETSDSRMKQKSSRIQTSNTQSQNGHRLA